MGSAHRAVDRQDPAASGWVISGPVMRCAQTYQKSQRGHIDCGSAAPVTPRGGVQAIEAAAPAAAQPAGLTGAAPAGLSGALPAGLGAAGPTGLPGAAPGLTGALPGINGLPALPALPGVQGS